MLYDARTSPPVWSPPAASASPKPRPDRTGKRFLARYGVAVAAVAVVTAIRLALDPVLGEHSPFLIFTLAVVAAAWYGGLRAALFAMALAALSSAFFVVPPKFVLVLPTTSAQAQFTLFLCTATGLSYLMDSLHRARIRAEVTEQKARASEEWLRVTLRSIGDGVIATDEVGRVAFMNPSAEQLTGWSAADAIDRPLGDVFRIVGEADRDPMEDPVARVLRDGSVVGLANHTVLVARDDKEYPIADSGAPILDDTGRIRGVVLVFQDGTAEREAARRLAASEAEFREAFERAGVGEAQVELSTGRFLRVNHMLSEITGCTADELTHMTFPELTHPDNRTADWKRFQAAVRGECPMFESDTRYIHKDGREIQVRVTATILRDAEGEPQRAMLVFQDVTERAKAEEALREGKALLRAVTDATSDLIYAKDLAGRLTLANPATLHVLGRTEEEAIGNRDVDFAPQPEQGRWIAEIDQRVLTTGREVREEEDFGPPGAVRTYSTTKAPLRDEHGAVVGLVGVSRDITDRKQAEEEVRRLNAELELRVDERTRALSEANAELEAFSYTIAHDLRAPVRNMHSLADALVEDHAEELSPDARDYTQRIVAAAVRMDDLIKDLLAYARLAREAIRLDPLDLDAVLTDVLGQMRPEIRERGAEVSVAWPLGRAVAQRTTLGQVVTNLLDNAIKFAEAGKKAVAHVRSEDRGDRVRLWVEDNGIGVEPEHRERIFRVFERLHAQEAYPGTGIGLAIVRKGAERMGGSCGVEENPGGGSRFWVELPKQENT
ncbi:PAS domain S-box protein [Polyangium mundeleinium]|uniref:histidine kinase n=1 Tax=Polyangium mundeleinium TaxID=2995306 RepID=A0ABT5F2N7_9BACT|nr:PAS domain S-box protein [Polyangium mundeleinium]MDC0747663.1 PAS domain S-box protein [Polyangium mundeleinium]